MLFHIFSAHNGYGGMGLENWIESLWHMWEASLGDFDDSNYPTTDMHFLFLFFCLTITIVMMNVLIAIVSDSYTNAVNRSLPLFWHARLDLVAEYEPLMPTLKNEGLVVGLSAEVTSELELEEKGQKEPEIWQWRVLKFQEGLLATGFVCGIVVFELLWVQHSTTENPNAVFDERFWWEFGISLFFFFELLLRVYTWSCSFSATTRKTVGSFLWHPFRFVDTTLVVADIIMLVMTMALANLRGNHSAKSSSKLARFFRFAKTIRWLKNLKAFRSCRFIAKSVNRMRRYAQPTNASLRASINSSFKGIEERASWAGRTCDSTKEMAQNIERNALKVMEGVKQTETQIQSGQTSRFEALLGAQELRFKALEQRLELVTTHLGIPPAPGGTSSPSR
mmetsp:Transcript_30816/g.69188  ORF Transcript_30816/g.69188 Transcript_30816/m.69188 type:complete len:393 (-) Transcript_30816:410-1588(-)